MDEAFIAEIDAFLRSFGLSTISEEDTRIESTAGVPYDNNEPHKKEENKLHTTTKRKLLRAEYDRKRRKLCHERQKRERESLKSQIRELSALLEEKVELTRSENCKNHGDVFLASSWEVIAKLQHGMRLAAEEKHQQLCLAVADKARLIQAYKAFANEFNSLHLLDDEFFKHKHARIEDFDVDIYRTYRQELQRTYAQTDDVFRARERSVNETIVKLGPTWINTGGAGSYFEYGDTRLLPFDFPQACQILWFASKMLHRQEARVSFDEVEDPDNTFAVKFRITSRLKSGETVSVMQSAVSRRYEESDRVVFVWREFVEGEGVFSGMNLDETGWCVLKRSTSGTEVEICVRDTPMHINHPAKEQDEQFTAFVLSAKTENYMEIVNILEQVLIMNVHV